MFFFSRRRGTFAPKNILIIAMRQLGDTLVTSPLIIKAHETWPDASIHFLGFSDSLAILKGHPYVDEWIGASQRPKFREYWTLFKCLFRRYDLALVTQPSDRAHLFGFLAARVRFGLLGNHYGTRWWKKLFCRHVVEIDYIHQHVVTEKLKLIPDGWETTSRAIKIRGPSLEPLPADVFNRLKCVVPIIVIHAAPLGAYKRILDTTWHDVINQLARDHVICLTGSIVDRALNQSIIAGVRLMYLERVFDLSGQLNFSQIATLLHRAILYIGVDTSISHLAAASETKSIILFGPTPPTNFGPWPNNTELAQPYLLRSVKQTQGLITILQGPGACVPCRKAGCNDQLNSMSRCLYELTAEPILAAAVEALGASAI